MAVCIQRDNVLNQNNRKIKQGKQNLEELKKTTEFAERLLDVLRQKNRMDFGPKSIDSKDIKKRIEVNREFSRLMEERLRMEF
jgi:hypothetical protein